MFVNKPEQDDTNQRGVIVSGVAAQGFGVSVAEARTETNEADTYDTYEQQQPTIAIETNPKKTVAIDEYESSEESSDEEDVATTTESKKNKVDRRWKWTPLAHHVALSCGGKSAQHLVPFWIGIILGLALLAIWICATIWYWCSQLICHYNDIITEMKAIGVAFAGNEKDGYFPQFKFSKVSYGTTPFKMILRCIIDSITSWFNYGPGEAFSSCCLGTKDPKTNLAAARLRKIAAQEEFEQQQLQQQQQQQFSGGGGGSDGNTITIALNASFGETPVVVNGPGDTGTNNPPTKPPNNPGTSGKGCCGFGKKKD